MKKIAVVYWSGTGNTEAMAKAVAAGVTEKGGEAELIFCTDFTKERVADYDGFAFGCPSMGDEVLEEVDFEPMFSAVKGKLSGKNVALFGSYGWGDGLWMRNWEEDCDGARANRVCDSVICVEEPNEEAVTQCKALGAALV